MKYCFGIDLGGTTVKCGLFTEEGELLDKWEIPTDTSEKGENIPADIAATILRKLDEKKLSKREILGIGMGIPGPVNSKGMVFGCANLGWGEFNVVDKMNALTGMRFVAGNDANVAALGEMWQGGAKGYDNVVMVTLGTGVGGGVIADGHIVAGSNGAGGEIGHIVVNPEETEACGCGGHGHLEQYASATGVVNTAKKYLAESKEASTLRDCNPLTAKDVFDAAKAGDALSLRVVDTFGRYLAHALGHIAAVADPDVFVLGGGVSRAGEIIIDTLKKYYGENLLSALRNKEFRFACLENDAGMYGSVKLLLTRLGQVKKESY